METASNLIDPMYFSLEADRSQVLGRRSAIRKIWASASLTTTVSSWCPPLFITDADGPRNSRNLRNLPIGTFFSLRGFGSFVGEGLFPHFFRENNVKSEEKTGGKGPHPPIVNDLIDEYVCDCRVDELEQPAGGLADDGQSTSPIVPIYCDL